MVLWICALDPFSYLIPAGATAAQCPGAAIVIFSAWMRRQKECEGKKNAGKKKQNKIQDQKENKKRKTRNKWGTGGACQSHCGKDDRARCDWPTPIPRVRACSSLLCTIVPLRRLCRGALLRSIVRSLRAQQEGRGIEIQKHAIRRAHTSTRASRLQLHHHLSDAAAGAQIKTSR